MEKIVPLRESVTRLRVTLWASIAYRDFLPLYLSEWAIKTPGVPPQIIYREYFKAELSGSRDFGSLSLKNHFEN